MSELNPLSNATNPSALPRDRATFIGTAYHKVSGKNQVAIPKHIKRILDEAQEGQLILMRWQKEPFLRLFTKKQFDKILDEVKRKPELSRAEQQNAVESLARGAEPVDPDSQGRFVLPAKWMDALNIREEVAFTGAFTFVKILAGEIQRELDRAEAEKLSGVTTQVTDILNM
jgi:MraZ protein